MQIFLSLLSVRIVDTDIGDHRARHPSRLRRRLLRLLIRRRLESCALPRWLKWR